MKRVRISVHFQKSKESSVMAALKAMSYEEHYRYGWFDGRELSLGYINETAVPELIERIDGVVRVQARNLRD